MGKKLRAAKKRIKIRIQELSFENGYNILITNEIIRGICWWFDGKCYICCMINSEGYMSGGRYLTRGEYLQSIEDALMEQRKRISSSKEEARKLIDSLGIRHLLIPIPPKKVRKKVVVRHGNNTGKNHSTKTAS